MTIRRAPRPRRCFTILANVTIEDSRLSFKALGLLTYLLSKPDNWTVNREHLAGTHTDGAESIRTALQELRSAGYIRDELQRDPGGKLQGKFAVVYDVAQVDDGDPSPSVGIPTSRSMRQTDETRVVRTNQEQELSEQEVVTSREQLTLDTRPTARRTDDLTLVGFDAFWRAYPLKVGKPSARRAWDKAIRRANPADIIAGARRYADDPHRKPDFTKYPGPWLNDDRWEAPPIAAPQATVPRSSAGRTTSTIRGVLQSGRDERRPQLPTTMRPALGGGS